MPKNLTNDYNFYRYIGIVLKQVHPDTSITEQALADTNVMLHLLMENLLDRACELTHKSHAKTLTGRSVESACKIVLPGELKKHAMHEGLKAVVKFESSTSIITDERKRIEKRAGMNFSVSRVDHLTRVHCPELKISEKAMVYLTAVLEYMCAEIMELSGNVARGFKKQRVTPHHISYAIQQDEEISALFDTVTLNGSVLPNIPFRILHHKKKA